MANPTVVQAVANDNGTTNSTLVLTLASVTVHSTIFVAFLYKASLGHPTQTADAVNGNGYSQIITPVSDGINYAATGYSFQNSGAGSTAITVTFNTVVPALGFAMEVSNVDQSGGMQGAVGSTISASTGFSVGPILPTLGNAFLVVAFSGTPNNSGLTCTKNASYSIPTGTGITAGARSNTVDGDTAFLEYLLVTTGPGSFTATGTWSTSLTNGANFGFAIPQSSLVTQTPSAGSMALTGLTEVDVTGTIITPVTARNRHGAKSRRRWLPQLGGSILVPEFGV